MNIRYRVTLSTAERAELAAMVQGGKGAARRLKRVQILFASDLGIDDPRGLEQHRSNFARTVHHSRLPSNLTPWG